MLELAIHITVLIESRRANRGKIDPIKYLKKVLYILYTVYTIHILYLKKTI